MNMKEILEILGNKSPEFSVTQYVAIKFTCPKCGKKFIENVNENKYKHVLRDPYFLKSRLCSECIFEVNKKGTKKLKFPF